MIKIDIMEYKVIRDIPAVYDSVDAVINDILTVGWYEADSCWALFKDDLYVCDLGSYYETRHCEILKPEISG
jgi:hypothetical protein